MERAGEEWKIRVDMLFQRGKTSALKEASEFAEWTSSGRSFQIIGASYAKLRPQFFRDLKTEAKRGTSRNMPSD